MYQNNLFNIPDNSLSANGINAKNASFSANESGEKFAQLIPFKQLSLQCSSSDGKREVACRRCLGGESVERDDDGSQFGRKTWEIEDMVRCFQEAQVPLGLHCPGWVQQSRAWNLRQKSGAPSQCLWLHPLSLTRTNRLLARNEQREKHQPLEGAPWQQDELPL